MNRRDFGKTVLATAVVAVVIPSMATGKPFVIGRYIKRYEKELGTSDHIVLGRSDGQVAEWPGCKDFHNERYGSYEGAFLSQDNKNPRPYTYQEFVKYAEEERDFYQKYAPKFSFEIISMEAR